MIRSYGFMKGKGTTDAIFTVRQIQENFRVKGRSFELTVITQQRSSSFAEYCKHIVARLNDVHAFGYNSTGSERIWMKFGELRVYCLDMSLTNFGRDPRRSGSGSTSRNFVFLSIKQCAISTTSGRPNFTKFAQKDAFPCALWGFRKHFWKYARKGSFFPKNLHFGLIKVNDFRLPAAISPKRLQILESHDRLDRLWNVDIDTVGMHSKWFPWPVARAHGEQFFPPKYSSTTYHRRRLHGMLHNAERCK